MTNLPAGPALDRLIAEKVMGWAYDGIAPRTPGQGGPIDAFVDIHGRRRWFSPSVYISHAWEVVENMASRKIYMDIIQIDDGWMVGHNDGNGYCDYSGTVDVKLSNVGLAPTPSLAICYAAMRVVAG
jgi:hypothetical protein